jgi:RsiW-degrading membrane proteinase PrsW (M82 family)
MYISSDLMALAIIPGLLLIIYVYRKDKVEKEPLGLIIRILIYGVISCIAAGFLEQLESQFLPQYPQGSVEYAVQTSFCMAALVEETVKFLAMRLGSWRYQGFNYRFDGIVYGVSAAVGFAVYENVMYVAMYGLQTAIVRAFTAIPLHAFCGVFMGVMYSYSKKASILGQGGKCVMYTIFALLLPMLIHGTYDTFAFLGERGTIPLLVFVVILYIAAISTINRMSREDYRAGFYPQARNIDYEVEL